MKKFKKVVILDTVIFYPEHRALLNKLAEEVLEFPSSLPERLEQQFSEQPELFAETKCYTELGANNTPLQLLMNRVEGAEVIVSCWTNIPDEILRLNPQLKLVIFWTHEKEHRINVDLARELGIEVKNIPDYGTEAVAEVVFAGMWQLLMRNYASDGSASSEVGLANAILNDVFTRIRMLPENEKNTRLGKFSHHFHKLGQVKFDFAKKSLEQLIPERMIEHKMIGLMNIEKAEETVKALRTFGVIIEERSITDFTLASTYKFLAENELIYYDKRLTPEAEVTKIEKMWPRKLVDVNSLVTSDYEFADKIFGLVGLGRIGEQVARMAKGLGFEVIYYSKRRNEVIEERLGIKYKEINELARVSDVISLHVPAHKAENVIDKKFIEAMKNVAMFINTADGNAIDQTALTERMTKKEIFAYLDVYPGLPRKDILGLPMTDKKDWKLHKELANNVLAYRAGWKTQESIKVKTYKLLGEMTSYLMNDK
ncbi:TPA: hypothetical protein DEP96_01505 [Candidatus Uhrbacteria bacterium]|nr:hypothetical protein [Candidatus Uhrbacteria bacterium]